MEDLPDLGLSSPSALYSVLCITPTHKDGTQAVLGNQQMSSRRTNTLLYHSVNERWKLGRTEDLMLFSVCMQGSGESSWRMWHWVV